jgi:hypothetical protein
MGFGAVLEVGLRSVMCSQIFRKKLVIGMMLFLVGGDCVCLLEVRSKGSRALLEAKLPPFSDLPFHPIVCHIFVAKVDSIPLIQKSDVMNG